MHRGNLPGDHLRQPRTDHLLTLGRQLPPQLVEPENRLRTGTFDQPSTGWGGALSR